MDDSAIVELFFERSEQAIIELSNKYEKVCKKTAQNILHNEHDAEECVNDGWLAVWNTIPPQNPNPLLSYVCRIVRNIAIKKYHENTAAKRNSYYDVALDELEECVPSASSIENESGANELSKAINAFLNSIDKENRVIFVRRYFYSDSIEDISNLIGTNRHNISVRLSRTRNKLRFYLLKEGVLV